MTTWVRSRLQLALAVLAGAIVGPGCGGASTSSYEGRVLVLQQADDGGQPAIKTSAEFSDRGQGAQAGGSVCQLSQHENCQVEACDYPAPFGGTASSDAEGLGPLVQDQYWHTFWDGTLTVSAGGASYAYDSVSSSPFLVLNQSSPQAPKAAWTTGDAISASWSGGLVPPFDATVSFPPRVVLDGPDLHDDVVLAVGHVVTISWSPPANAPSSGIVEATYKAAQRGLGVLDSNERSTITRCMAPLISGSLTFTIPPLSLVAPGMASSGAYGQLIVRVSNSVTVDVAGKASVRVAVASVEQRYTASPSPPDAGAD